MSSSGSPLIARTAPEVNNSISSTLLASMGPLLISSLAAPIESTHFVQNRKKYSQRDDLVHRLVQGCLQGQGDAQRKLFDEVVPILRSVARRYVWDDSYVEDVLQETFIRIFQNLSQFDSQRGSFVAWSTKIAANCAIRFGQNQRQHKHQELTPHYETTQSPEVESSLVIDDIMDTLKHMPSDFRNVLMLHAIEGFQHDEIALMLEISAASSRQRMSRARQWLSTRYHVDNGELLPLPSPEMP